MLQCHRKPVMRIIYYAISVYSLLFLNPKSKRTRDDVLIENSILNIHFVHFYSRFVQVELIFFKNEKSFANEMLCKIFFLVAIVNGRSVHPLNEMLKLCNIEKFSV